MTRVWKGKENGVFNIQCSNTILVIFQSNFTIIFFFCVLYINYWIKINNYNYFILLLLQGTKIMYTLFIIYT